MKNRYLKIVVLALVVLTLLVLAYNMEKIVEASGLSRKIAVLK